MVLSAADGGLKVPSKVPFVFTRVILFIKLVPYLVWPPAIIIFPSDCKAASYTVLFGPLPGLKVVLDSSAPVALILAIPFLLLPLHLLKSPTTINLPSGWMSTLFTVLSKPELNVASNVPVVVTLTIFVKVDVVLYAVKLPPKIILPSVWICVVRTEPLDTPKPPVLKVGSSLPVWALIIWAVIVNNNKKIIDRYFCRGFTFSRSNLTL